jgi:hypothetical protein
MLSCQASELGFAAPHKATSKFSRTSLHPNRTSFRFKVQSRKAPEGDESKSRIDSLRFARLLFSDERGVGVMATVLLTGASNVFIKARFP